MRKHSRIIRYPGPLGMRTESSSLVMTANSSELYDFNFNADPYEKADVQ